MSAESPARVHATPETWTSPATGITYPTSKFHWWNGKIAICPACDERPCDPDCPEQLLPKPARRSGAVP